MELVTIRHGGNPEAPTIQLPGERYGQALTVTPELNLGPDGWQYTGMWVVVHTGTGLKLPSTWGVCMWCATDYAKRLLDEVELDWSAITLDAVSALEDHPVREQVRAIALEIERFCDARDCAPGDEHDVPDECGDGTCCASAGDPEH